MNEGNQVRCGKRWTADVSVDVKGCGKNVSVAVNEKNKEKLNLFLKFNVQQGLKRLV